MAAVATAGSSSSRTNTTNPTWFESLTERFFESFTTCVCGDASMTTTTSLNDAYVHSYPQQHEVAMSKSASISLLSFQQWSGLELETSTMGASSYTEGDYYFNSNGSYEERRSCGTPELKPSNIPVLRELPSFSTQRSRSVSSYSYSRSVTDDDDDFTYEDEEVPVSHPRTKTTLKNAGLPPRVKTVLENKTAIRAQPHKASYFLQQ